MSRSDAIKQFWRSFEQKAGALAQVKSADESLYDELLEELQRVDEGLYIEISTPPGQCKLIITAEGNRELFELVDDVVSAAPQVNGWTVIALKPKLGFPAFAQWEGVRIDIKEVVFEPLIAEDSDELGLRLLVPGIDEHDLENAHNGLLRALDHILGERQFAESVQFTELDRLEEPSDEYIPLVELEQFIEWRAKQRKH
jgi:hypothetical protein